MSTSLPRLVCSHPEEQTAVTACRTVGVQQSVAAVLGR